MEPINVVIYHADCADGTASAWAAWKKFGSDARYIAMRYDDPRAWAGFSGCHVFFVDFSWPRADLEALATVAASVTVLDHHKTARAALSGIPATAPGRCRIDVVFDMDKSGARLTREWFAGGSSLLVDYVEDRDLWRFKLPYSKEISAFIRTFRMSVEDYDRANYLLHNNFMFATEIGFRALVMQEIMVDALIQRSYLARVGGYDGIPVCNVPAATLLQSEVGDALCKRHREAPFAAVYYDLGRDARGWSLRSRPDVDGVLFDVSTVAKAYGGGGHAGAAGFTASPVLWPTGAAPNSLTPDPA